VHGCGFQWHPRQTQTIRYFIVPADGTAVLLLIIEGRLRQVSDLWAPCGKTRLAYDRVWARRTLSAMAIEKLIASANIHFDFHVSGADVLA
jgi:hypothetical protein